MPENDPILVRRREVAVAMQEIGIASQDLKALLGRVEITARQAVRRIERGTKALDVAETMGLADHRETLNEAASRVRKGRHELQLAMFLLAEAEGATRAEIARTWRVSRQLISRMMRKG